MSVYFVPKNPAVAAEEERRRRGASGTIGGIGAGSGSRARKPADMLRGLAGEANSWANQGQQGYGNMTDALQSQRDFLQQLASGQHSVAAEQLRQGMQQNVSAQQSLAAGARPGNAAMAARTAAMNAGRIGSGLSGQQALAGLMERQQAQQALANLNLGQRGQDIQVGLGGRGQAIDAYGNILGQPKGPSSTDRFLQAASIAAGMAALSDERLKTDIKSGDRDAKTALEKLAAYSFRYKDQKHGKGKQVGIMAQDLERAGLGHAVMETEAGKAVHGAKLATSNTAMLAALAKRVSNLEGGK